MDTQVEHVNKVLILLEAAVVPLKLSKCALFQNMVDYLAHTIMQGKFPPVIDIDYAVHQAAFPPDKTDIKPMLGAYNVYRRFITQCARHERHRSAMLKNRGELDWENPMEAQIKAFAALKQDLFKSPVPSLPKKKQPFMIDTDASKYAMEATPYKQSGSMDSNTGAP